MGRYGWNGRILQVEVNSVLVDWGYRTEWLDRVEIYPLDRFGKPRIPGKACSVGEVARRARLALKTKQNVKISATRYYQLRFF